jgi:hypothetical protein
MRATKGRPNLEISRNDEDLMAKRHRYINMSSPPTPVSWYRHFSKVGGGGGGGNFITL